jgi:flagellar biosynthesis/type III secretory pathway chaperone
MTDHSDTPAAHASAPADAAPTAPPAPAGDVHRDPRSWLPRLTRLLDEQIGVYEQLGALAQEQHACVESGDTDALLRILGRRQQLIDDLASRNTELEPFVSRWNDLAQAVSEDDRAALRARIERVETLVDQIAKQDEADHAALEQRRQATAGQMQSLASKRSAVAAYGGPQGQSGGAARYQDRRA